MNDEVYRRLAKVLDTLPNGFPPTESGVEIKLVKKIFEPDEADLFCKLKLNYETSEQIAQRSGLPQEGLADKLESMRNKGQIESRLSEGIPFFRMMPWIVGIYEFQLKRMDKEFAELVEEYAPFLGPQLVMTKPQLMQVLPIEKIIPTNYEALPYEKVSNLIENGKSFMVNDCICRKRTRLIGKGCDKPLEICMAIGDEPGLWDNHPMGGRIISKQEAYDLLQKAEEAALVHMTSNVKNGQWYICNCCGCCDGQLVAAGAGLPGIINSHFYAEIDPELCTACGTCADERCQVKAIEEVDGTYRVNRAKCIGCGLCVSTCPTEAMQLIHKTPEEIEAPAKDEMDWWEKRALARGVDFNLYK
jgi:H+/Na+-translocating ferredoxin:NAD+ oxidoreductase subunit B